MSIKSKVKNKKKININCNEYKVTHDKGISYV